VEDGIAKVLFRLSTYRKTNTWIIPETTRQQPKFVSRRRRYYKHNMLAVYVTYFALCNQLPLKFKIQCNSMEQSPS